MGFKKKRHSRSHFRGAHSCCAPPPPLNPLLSDSFCGPNGLQFSWITEIFFILLVLIQQSVEADCHIMSSLCVLMNLIGWQAHHIEEKKIDPIRVFIFFIIQHSKSHYKGMKKMIHFWHLQTNVKRKYTVYRIYIISFGRLWYCFLLFISSSILLQISLSNKYCKLNSRQSFPVLFLKSIYL